MGGKGRCCCTPDCCLEDTDYPNWEGYEPGTCCRICEFDIVDDPWILVCSDPIRTDTRFAEAEYKYYSTPYTVYHDDQEDFPPCPSVPTPKTLCATINETHQIETVERLMMRYRKISQSSSIAKLEIQCGEEEERVCRWVVSSHVCFEVEYGQFEFTSEDHDVTATDSSCCPVSADYLKNIHTSMPTCEEKASLGFPTATTVCIKRIKVFDTAPTGEITFSDGDWIDCEDIGVCIRSGVESFTLNSVDFGYDAWTHPTCYNQDIGHFCRFVHYPIAEACIEPLPPGTVIGEQQTTSYFVGDYECVCTWEWTGGGWTLVDSTCEDAGYNYECFAYTNYAQAEEFLVGTITPAVAPAFLFVPNVEYVCYITCDQLNTVPPFEPPNIPINVEDGWVSEKNCTIISTSRPTPYYTARSLSLPTLPPWTIDLDACP